MSNLTVSTFHPYPAYLVSNCCSGFPHRYYRKGEHWRKQREDRLSFLAAFAAPGNKNTDSVVGGQVEVDIQRTPKGQSVGIIVFQDCTKLRKQREKSLKDNTPPSPLDTGALLKLLDFFKNKQTNK